MPMGLRYAALSLGQAALGLASCSGTSRISGETWQAALSLSRSAEQLQFSAGTWSEWSKAWRPLAMEVVSDFDGSMADCPEGSVAALAHGLLAVDEVDGHFSVLEIIKMMHHKLSDLQLPAFPLEPSEWQQHWLMVVSSMLRFMYLKWVNMPHDNDFADVNQEDAFSPAVLRPHHDFLFRNFVDKFLASGVYDLSITENTVLYSEAFAFLAFCHLHQVDFIAESGVYKGVSTEIWSLFAKEVAAVDIFLTPEAEERLQRRSNVELHTGRSDWSERTCIGIGKLFGLALRNIPDPPPPDQPPMVLAGALPKPTFGQLSPTMPPTYTMMPTIPDPPKWGEPPTSGPAPAKMSKEQMQRMLDPVKRFLLRPDQVCQQLFVAIGATTRVEGLLRNSFKTSFRVPSAGMALPTKGDLMLQAMQQAADFRKTATQQKEAEVAKAKAGLKEAAADLIKPVQAQPASAVELGLLPHSSDYNPKVTIGASLLRMHR